jgi:polygalacturonase
MKTTRRDFLLAGASAAAVSGLPASAFAADPWARAADIVARIKAPVFPQQDFDITKYGARADGTTDCTEAIARAIGACNAAGGGRVVVPAGTFSTAPIHLKSNVNLYLADAAVLSFSRDTARYLPVVYTRWEGVECLNYSAQIYADGQENIALTGSGTLEGNADCRHWWPWKGRTNCGWSEGQPNQDPARNALFNMGDKDVPLAERIFGEGHYLRPNMVQFCRSKNILIEGVTMKNSPMFEINPVLCRNVTVRGVTIASHGPNTDGCDPDSSQDVLIENCSFDTGDDCLAIKAGRNHDGRRVGVASENIVVRNCKMKEGHGGLTIGSEMSGGVRNVFFENCDLSSPNLNQALRLKTNAMRGGTIEHIYFRNIRIGEVSAAVLQIDFTYEEGAAGPERPNVGDIHLENVTCRKSKVALELRGFENAPIHDVTLRNCAFHQTEQTDILEHVRRLKRMNVKENGKLVV